jgi:hypothetical protein
MTAQFYADSLTSLVHQHERELLREAAERRHRVSARRRGRRTDA